MNTIYDGTFTIGQTSATNFIAGPGIKIDSPSAGTVRIGNDETVLWSGSGITTAFELSEAASGFDKIRYEWKWNNSVDNATMDTLINTDSRIFNLFSMCENGSNNKYYTIGRFTFDESYMNLSYVSGWQAANGVPTTATNQERFISIRKIVGVNRKENA